jgi:hypothetical protein
MDSLEQAGNTLALEAQRYLAVVDAFRAEGYEPDWRPETWMERARLDGCSTRLRLESDERSTQCSN